MKYLIRLYHGKSEIDAEVSGDGRIALTEVFPHETVECLARKGVFFTPSPKAWQFTAAEPVLLKKESVLSGELRPGELMLVDKAQRLALTVFPLQPRYGRRPEQSGEPEHWTRRRL